MIENKRCFPVQEIISSYFLKFCFDIERAFRKLIESTEQVEKITWDDLNARQDWNLEVVVNAEHPPLFVVIPCEPQVVDLPFRVTFSKLSFKFGTEIVVLFITILLK